MSGIVEHNLQKLAVDKIMREQAAGEQITTPLDDGTSQEEYKHVTILSVCSSPMSNKLSHGNHNGDHRSRSSLRTSHFVDVKGAVCWHQLLKATVLGIQPPFGSIRAMIEQWNSLALLSALLTGVASAGLFQTGDFLREFNQDGGNESKRMWGKWTMIFFCIDTFCFLNATVVAITYAGFAHVYRDEDEDAARSHSHSRGSQSKQKSTSGLQEMHHRLGWLYHWPQVYFRLGFIFLLLALSLFFIMVMDVAEMGGCLVFCIAFVILPMVFVLMKVLLAFA